MTADAARAAFTAFVRERHGFDPRKVVERPELDGGGFHGFTAVGTDSHVRGLAAPDEVITHALPDAFARWVAAVDFAHAPDADAVRFVRVHESLRRPGGRYAELVVPLLTEAEIAASPLDGVAEPVEPPRVDDEGDGRCVSVWYQAEPGPQFVRCVFHISGDNAVSTERRAAHRR